MSVYIQKKILVLEYWWIVHHIYNVMRLLRSGILRANAARIRKKYSLIVILTPYISANDSRSVHERKFNDVDVQADTPFMMTRLLS